MVFFKLKWINRWRMIQHKANLLVNWLNRPAEGIELAAQYGVVFGTFFGMMIIMILLVSVLP